MNSKILGLLVVGLMACLDARAQSVEVLGAFTGFVDAGGTGTIGTLNASTVAAGTPVFGTFSYNAQIFPLGGVNENGFYVATGSTNPVVITEIVDGSAFTVYGTVQSVLNLASMPPTENPNNQFYLEAANWGVSVPGLSGSIDLNLSNYLGAPFASNVDNPGSVAFANQNGLGVNNIDTLQGINSQGNSTGSLYFSISHASAGNVTLAAPEIDPTSTASGLTLLLGSLLVLRSRRPVKLDSAAV
jgi:hypothetical protein